MFKKVFGDEKDQKPLRKLLECILGIYPEKIVILNPEILGTSYHDKRTSVDLIVKLEDGTKIGIEMNTNVNKHLINRNLFYMFKIMSKDMKKGTLYDKLNKHIQINFDCEGYHEIHIMKYRMMELETQHILTDKLEIIRVDVPYFVNRCYNKDVSKLDYKDKFIGLIGIDDKKLAESITKGDAGMEDIMKKVEDFSDDDEIIGAYDGEWHRKEVERLVRLEQIEKAQEEGLARGMAEGIEKGIEQGIEKEKLNIARNMLKEKINVEIISKVTGLSIEHIKGL